MEKPHYIEDLTQEIKSLSSKLDKHIEESHIHIGEFHGHLKDDERDFGELKETNEEILEKVDKIIPALYEKNLELINDGHAKIMKRFDELDERIEPLDGVIKTFKAFGLIREPAEGLVKWFKFWTPLFMIFGLITLVGWVIINKLWASLLVLITRV